MNHTTHRHNARRGTVYILSLIFLAMFSMLAGGFLNATALSVRSSGNQRGVLDAQLAAESGLSFMLQRLYRVRLPGNTTGPTFAASLCDQITATMGGTANLSGIAITADGDSRYAPF